MRIRYTPDRTEHRAWLGRPRRATPDAEGSALFVQYGAAIAVSRLEAERDCELLAASRLELAGLRAAGYHIPLAGDFRGADGLPAQVGRSARPRPLSGVRG
jgi:hypothetical protein